MRARACIRECVSRAYAFVYVQSNFNGSNTLGTMEISSKQG